MLEGRKVKSITLKVLQFEIHDLWDSKRINMKIKTLGFNELNKTTRDVLSWHINYEFVVVGHN